MSTLRKRRLDQSGQGAGNTAGDAAPLDVARLATIAYSSEDPAHPIEHLLDERSGPGGSRWAAAQPDTIATSCPYCIMMLEDATRTQGKYDALPVRDIAELLAEALNQ